MNERKKVDNINVYKISGHLKKFKKVKNHVYGKGNGAIITILRSNGSTIAA